MRALALPLAALIAATTACSASGTASSVARASGPAQRPVGTIDGANIVITAASTPDVSTLAAPMAQSWNALRAAYDSLGIPVTSQDPQRRIIGNEAWKVRQRIARTPLSRFLDCGSSQIGPNADSYDVVLFVQSQLLPADAGSTKLSTIVEAQARPATYNQAWSRCSTKGALETRIADLVKAQLAR
jgi:hypothetical protein